MNKKSLAVLSVISILQFTAPASDLFDAGAFFAKNFIVDGLGTYYDGRHPYPQEEGPWDLAPLKQETGSSLIVMSYSTQRSFELQAERFEKGVYHNATLIRTFADIRKLRESGDFGVLMYVQQPYPLNGRADTIEGFFNKGLRVFQLAYGAQHEGQAPEDVLAYGNDQDGGVTALGEQVISELNRLGMVVDISHCNETTVLDACRLSTAPVVCTHAGARAITPRDRNHTDRAIQTIAETGGVFGITAVGWIIENHKTKKRGIAEFCDHVDYVRDLVGIEHVGVSTDSPLRGWDRLSPHRTSPELSEIGHWKSVATELYRRGYSEEDLKLVFGFNFVRVFREVLEAGDS